MTPQVPKQSTKTFLNLLGNQKWEEEEIQDAFYWLKQVLALFIGILWGIFGFTGSMAILSAAISHTIITYAILNNSSYDFEPEEVSDILKSNLMQTFAAFLASWIVFYTALGYGNKT